METFISVIVLAFFAYGAYKLWYVPRETAKKAEGVGSRPVDPVKQAKK